MENYMKRIKSIARVLKEHHYTDCYFVGGCVRDELMGNTAEDVDVCLVGAPEHIGLVLDALCGLGYIDRVTSVHGSFPIWILEFGDVKCEYALARTERLTGDSRIDFAVETAGVTIREDLSRRDLTINAIAKNVLTGELVDPFGGQYDIHRKRAAIVSSAFAEDTLRVYRAARFIARFDLTPSTELLEVCESLKPTDISDERVGMELMKMFKIAKKPSKFFWFLMQVGWLGYHFKEVEALIGVHQSPKHHPEGDAFTHTMHCLDATNGDDWFTRAVMMCHDLGKATCTKLIPIEATQSGFWDPEMRCYTSNFQAKITSVGHEEAGVQLTKDLLQRIHFTDHKTIRAIACLVKNHMVRIYVKDGKIDEKIVRRTLRELMHYKVLYHSLREVVRCDLAGRPPLPMPKEVNLIGEDIANQLILNGDMDPIVTGKKLLALGLEPSPAIGQMVEKGLELQDRGTLRHDNWIKVLLGSGFKQLRPYI